MAIVIVSMYFVSNDIVVRYRERKKNKLAICFLGGDMGDAHFRTMHQRIAMLLVRRRRIIAIDIDIVTITITITITVSIVKDATMMMIMLMPFVTNTTTTVTYGVQYGLLRDGMCGIVDGDVGNACGIQARDEDGDGGQSLRAVIDEVWAGQGHVRRDGASRSEIGRVTITTITTTVSVDDNARHDG